MEQCSGFLRLNLPEDWRSGRGLPDTLWFVFVVNKGGCEDDDDDDDNDNDSW